MDYIEGFVAAVLIENKAKYEKHAKDAAVVFKEHGATRVVECWEDDVPEGEVTSFSMAVQRKSNEAIVFSWIARPSKAARDVGMKKVMDDPRMNDGSNPMPFDGKRLIYGGFKMILDE